MTWPYRELVLDLEPQGPLPPEIYKRRRMLAIGVAAFVLAIVVTVVVVVISNATGDTKTEAEGAAEKAAGKVQNAVGGMKDAAREAVDK